MQMFKAAIRNMKKTLAVKNLDNSTAFVNLLEYFGLGKTLHFKPGKVKITNYHY